MKKVRTFRESLQKLDPPVFYAEYPDVTGFQDVFDNDLSRWLADPVRPWVVHKPLHNDAPQPRITPPLDYYQNLEHDFHRLDIAESTMIAPSRSRSVKSMYACG
jgi:hypothetical protein